MTRTDQPRPANAPVRPPSPQPPQANSLRRWLVLAVAVVLLVAAAAVEGVFSNRWGVSEDGRIAAAKLGGVPAAFGDWTSEEQALEPKVLRVAEATGHVSRFYTNRKKNIGVSVLLLCGPPGPIGAHTPEVCYAGNGHEMSGAPSKKAVGLPDGTAATYWSARFEKKGAAFDQPLRVCWMWGVDGEWQAAGDPRTEFALRSSLYKLYVQQADARQPSAGAPPDQIQEFLTDFLPEVKKALTAPAGQPDAK